MLLDNCTDRICRSVIVQQKRKPLAIRVGFGPHDGAGLDGAIDGIRAVEKNLMPGKILVYPSCRGLKLTPLTELGGTLPLENGRWTRQAEESLVKQFSKP